MRVYKRRITLETVKWMMVCLIGAIGLRVAVSNVRSADAEPSKSKDTVTSFEARAAHMVDRVARHGAEHGFWGGGKYGAYPAMAQFAAGHIDRGRRFAERQLTGSGAMFREFGTMALYAAYHEKDGSELRQKVKQNQLESDFFNEDQEGRDALGGCVGEP